MSTSLKLGLSGYDVKPRFGAFQCEYLLQNPLFFLGKYFGDTRHPYEKNEPTLDYSGGGGGARQGLLAHSLLVYFVYQLQHHWIFYYVQLEFILNLQLSTVKYIVFSFTVCLSLAY